jgi:hypothetical protein
MGNFKVGDTFDDIKASFLRKERVSLQNSNENGANYITDATVDDIIRHITHGTGVGAWTRTGGLIGEAKLIHGFSPDLLIMVFYFVEENRIGFLFEQEYIVSNDYAFEYSFGQQDVRFDVSDMEKSRKVFWDKVSNLYARAVLDEMEDAFERNAFGPVID